MAIEFSNGCYALNYGTINTCSPDEGENWEETHQKIYYQSVLCLALKLDLYTEVNGQFYLTKWGLRAAERRQNMSLIEARALVGKTMETQSLGLKMMTEEDRRLHEVGQLPLVRERVTPGQSNTELGG
jgi:hypothetical protein